jgi:hypothetical protein
MTLADCSTDLRPADAAECIAMGLTPEQSLILSMKDSLGAFCVEVDGKPLAFWGYSGALIGGEVYGWLLTCPGIEDHKFRFARSSQRVTEWLLSTYTRIIIVVHKDHTLSRKWLAWLGFKEISGTEVIYMAKEN